MADHIAIRKIVGDGFTGDPTRSYTPDAEYYYSTAVFSAEAGAIFHKHWLYLCHESQLPEPGDYVTGEVVGQSVFVIRGKDGVVRGFFNVCRHRAHEILSGAGHVRASLRCPYHSWVYDLDGRLMGAPQCKAVPEFDRGEFNLAAIGVEVLGGFVFVNLDPGAGPLRKAVPRLEQRLLEMAPGAAKLRCAQRWDVGAKANWKVGVENFLENYHTVYSGRAHEQLCDIIDAATYEVIVEDKLITFLGRGGAPEKLPYGPYEARKLSGRGEGFFGVFIWPNVTFLIFPGVDVLTVILWNPVGPETLSQQVLYFSGDGELTEGGKALAGWLNKELNGEDTSMIESVQRGLHSLGYRRGRLMVDADKKEGWSEHLLHHFNTLNLKALEHTGP